MQRSGSRSPKVAELAKWAGWLDTCDHSAFLGNVNIGGILRLKVSAFTCSSSGKIFQMDGKIRSSDGKIFPIHMALVWCSKNNILPGSGGEDHHRSPQTLQWFGCIPIQLFSTDVAAMKPQTMGGLRLHDCPLIAVCSVHPLLCLLGLGHTSQALIQAKNTWFYTIKTFPFLYWNNPRLLWKRTKIKLTKIKTIKDFDP